MISDLILKNGYLSYFLVVWWFLTFHLDIFWTFLLQSFHRTKNLPWQNGLLEDSLRAAGISSGLESGTKVYVSNLDVGVTNSDIRVYLEHVLYIYTVFQWISFKICYKRTFHTGTLRRDGWTDTICYPLWQKWTSKCKLIFTNLNQSLSFTINSGHLIITCTSSSSIGDKYPACFLTRELYYMSVWA